MENVKTCNTALPSLSRGIQTQDIKPLALEVRVTTFELLSLHFSKPLGGETVMTNLTLSPSLSPISMLVDPLLFSRDRI